MNLMIHLIFPNVPTLPDWQTESFLVPLSYASFFIIAGIAAFIVGMYAAKHFKGDKIKTIISFVGITVAVTTLLICFVGATASAAKGTLFCLILMYCSYSDIKTRESDDYAAVMILLTAFIDAKIVDIPMMVLSAAFIIIPMLAVTVVCKGKTIGGADIKLSTACAFLLGTVRGFAGLIIGLAAGILVNLIIRTKKQKADGFPLIPYLAAGFMAAYFM